ncbi:MAG: InlB B-repeat-containing protein, partial [Firmicutes bacterium]|nr:InlB B-repeat-containing protein [Bacillota bacterium]
SEKTTTATNYDLSNLADGKTYQIKVKATKGSVESSWSNTVSYTPEPPKVHVQVSFDANGGSNLSQTSKQVTLGETYGVLPTVTPPSDLSFVGWFDDKTGGNKVTSATKVTNQNAHTLYARFGEKVVGDTSPDAVEARLRNYMPQDLYETFFPERYGKFSSWHESEEDYYSYDQLIKGVRELANRKLRNIRENINLGDVGKVFITDKSTGVETMVFESVDFNANSTALFETIVDYGSFMADGDENTQKRDLAGFLGQISHETNRFGTSSNTREGALGFQQELNHSDTAGTEYTTQDQYPGSNTYNPTACKNFPPNLNKSYHGRGPMQLSWNYNYGLFSAMFFGDKMVLLDDPGMLARDGNGDLALAASLWFWMTPQGLKPSCHDVITGVYQPTAEDIADGRTADKIGFGWTIIIVNGYYEAETSRDGSVTSPNGNYSGQMDDRIQFYEFFTGNAWKPTGGIPGVTTTGLEADIDGEQLDTVGMKAYAW